MDARNGSRGSDPTESADTPPGFSTVILLSAGSGIKELSTFLTKARPDIDIHPVKSRDALDRVTEYANLSRTRLIAFGTDVVVSEELLSRLGFGAYNFHPGPPDYPGWAPASFAVYDGARSFGATAHVMTAKVDAGPIVGVRLFPVPPRMTANQLALGALVAALELFRELGPLLVNASDPLPVLPLSWSRRKHTRAEFRQMCDLPPDITEDELKRRTAAFDIDEPWAPGLFRSLTGDRTPPNRS